MTAYEVVRSESLAWRPSMKWVYLVFIISLALLVIAFSFEVLSEVGTMPLTSSQRRYQIFAEAIGIIGFISLGIFGILGITMQKKIEKETNQLNFSLSEVTATLLSREKMLADIAAFSQKVLEEKFQTHGLTASERGVALELLTTKSYEDIARSRSVSVGTIKAQASRIYAKLRVNQRHELALIFLSYFLGEKN